MAISKQTAPLGGLYLAMTGLDWLAVCAVSYFVYQRSPLTGIVLFVVGTAAALTHVLVIGLHKTEETYDLAAYLVPVVALVLVALAAAVLGNSAGLAGLAGVALGLGCLMLASTPNFQMFMNCLAGAASTPKCTLDLRAFLINLPASELRRANVESRLALTDIKDNVVVEYFPAVHAKLHLPALKAKNIISPLVWRFLPVAVGGGGQTRQFHDQIDTLGAIGCTLSHYGVWQRIKESQVAYGMVLEDDVLCDPFILDAVCDAISTLRAIAWDVLLLGGARSGASNPRRVASNILQIDAFFGTHCYIVTKAGATKLLNAPNRYPIVQHVDAQMSEWSRHGDINMLALENVVAWQASSSEIKHGPHAQSGMSMNTFRDQRDETMFDPPDDQ